MRRAPALAAFALVATIAAACSGGSSKAATATTAAPVASTTTVTALAATTVLSTAPTTAVTVAPSTTVGTPPPDTCLLFASSEASSLVKITVTGSPSVAGSTDVCTYKGGKAKVTLSVTQLADPATAHSQYAQVLKSLTALATVGGVGEEAALVISGIAARSGRVVITIIATPQPASQLLEAAAQTVLRRF